MSPPTPTTTTKGNRFPRVSGDEPAHAILGQPANVFSPRERG